MTALAVQAAGRQETSPNLGQKLPTVSCSMKRPTRVPASTAVRMNSASNMIAKWYQNACRPPPNASENTWESPNARVGAPPVRETSVSSSIESAAAWRVSGEIVNPRPLTNCAAPCTVPPVAPAGEFIA